jgi:Uma2 family endonuclease
MTAARKLPQLMTVAEFLDWSGDEAGLIYELVDGTPRAMAPAADGHGTIQANLITRITNHLEGTRPGCRLFAAPGIQPRLRAEWNHRIPEMGVTCSPNLPGMVMMPDPLLLIEILSPGNASDTWSNIPLYASIPTVQEIVIVHSTAIKAEVLRRGVDSSWPQNSEVTTGMDGAVTMESIGLPLPMQSIYRNTYLAAVG